MTIQASILIIEDDPGIVDILNVCLEDAGYRPVSAANLAEAWHILDREKPDLLLLDWMLDGEDGAHFFRQLKSSKNFHDLPVIMLTARNTDEDQAFMLDQGVEDFVGKPFSQEALLARIRAVLRRTAVASELSVGNLTLDLKMRTICCGDACATLFPVESRLLLMLMRKPGRVFSREDIMANLNMGGQVVELRTVDVHVSRLRRELKKTGSDPIRTVRGVGYLFEAVATNYD